MTTLLFLALILTFEMLPVSPTTTSQTTTGEISIIEEGSLEAGSALILSCTIPDFTGSAQWGRDNNIYTTCLYAGFCSVVHTENYTFGSNASGIFVTINPLSMVDNGSIWMCSNQVYTTSYTVIVQTTIAPTTGKISINGIGSLEVDSVLTLSCIIPAFTGGATWRRGNINLVTCAFNSFCTIESTERYTFAGNNSGIFVTIYTLSMSDNGTKWICYDGDDSTSYTVFVQPSITTNQPPTEPSITTNQPPTGSCQKPYNKIGNGCYSIYDDNISGDEAFASCTDPGAYLANFETLEEAMFMKVFLQRNKTGISYFVGGRNVNRYLSSGDWRWIKHGNATKMTYFAFAPGQPSWSAEKGEDCMFFYANDRYNFYNVMCDNGHFLGGFICEI